MKLSAGSGKLSQALKKLRLRWDDTKAQWKDLVSQDFEDKQLGVLEAQTMATLRELDRLGLVLTQAYRDCS